MAETAQCFSTHHVALLVGYGAHAVSPYLAFETCRQWRASSRCAHTMYIYIYIYTHTHTYIGRLVAAKRPWSIH